MRDVYANSSSPRTGSRKCAGGCNSIRKQGSSSNAVVDLGHSRWDIENQGFNGSVNQWHSDHVYRHDPTAILAFWLLAMLVINVFRAFYLRNLKPQRRCESSMLHIARRLAAELYQGLGRYLLPVPT